MMFIQRLQFVPCLWFWYKVKVHLLDQLLKFSLPLLSETSIYRTYYSVNRALSLNWKTKTVRPSFTCLMSNRALKCLIAVSMRYSPLSHILYKGVRSLSSSPFLRLNMCQFSAISWIYVSMWQIFSLKISMFYIAASDVDTIDFGIEDNNSRWKQCKIGMLFTISGLRVGSYWD